MFPIFSVENLFKWRYTTVQTIVNEIFVNVMVDSNVGTITNIIATLFQFIAIGLWCETFEKPNIL